MTDAPNEQADTSAEVVADVIKGHTRARDTMLVLALVAERDALTAKYDALCSNSTALSAGLENANTQWQAEIKRHEAVTAKLSKMNNLAVRLGRQLDAANEANARAAQAVTVNPLEWRVTDETDGEPRQLVAESHGQKWCMYRLDGLWHCGNMTAPDLDDAKSVVQARHDKETLSLITARPESEVAAEALEKAANACDERADRLDEFGVETECCVGTARNCQADILDLINTPDTEGDG